MSWKSLEEDIPPLEQEVYLCTAGDSFQWIDEGSLKKNSFFDEYCSDEFMFDGPGWYVPRPISSFTHWHPKILPIHVDLTIYSEE